MASPSSTKPRFASICVYCASSNNVPDSYFALARSVGRDLAQRGIEVIYGGGSVGLMGALADAALAAGGRVVGVIPEKLQALELGHTGLQELRVVPDMHTRKALMADLAEAFIALPGGWGTLEELFEAVTWLQLRYHSKPVGLLNHEGFYDGLIGFLDHAHSLGFIRPQHRPLLQSASDVRTLLERLSGVQLPELSAAVIRGTRGG